jgi:pimeloyl-ACP methyl ester carboxylesterase
VTRRRRHDFVVEHDPTIAVREWPGDGDGDGVLLLHGLSHNLEVWTPVAELLPLECRVVAIDLRGHGRSGTSAGHGYREHAGDVAAVLAALRIESCVIAGHSWGARVALYFAAEAGDRCRGVVAVDQALWDYEPPSTHLGHDDLGELEPLPTTAMSDDEASALRGASLAWGTVWASVIERSLEETAAGWIRRPVPNDVRALTIAESGAQPVEHLYAQMKAPAVMLFATDDDDFGFAPPIGRIENVEHLRTVLPGARIEWIVGNHSFLVEDPAPVAAAITSLWSRA